MRKVVVACYTVCFIFVIVFVVYAMLNLSVVETNQRHEQDFEVISQYVEKVIKDAEAPAGVRREFTFKLDNVGQNGETLAFLTIHQNVQIYLADELVYERKLDTNNLFGKTPGNSWNAMEIRSDDLGKTVKVVLEPAYEGNIDTVVEFCLGSKFSIWKQAIKRDIIPDVLSVFVILVGILFIIFVLLNFKNTEVNRSLFFMGVFSVCIGCWKISDTDSAVLIFDNPIVASYIPFVCLLLAIVPFTMFVRTLFSNRESKSWYAVCFGSMGIMLLTLALQVLGIMDMRESLPLNHATMLFMAVVAIIEVVREWKKHGLSHKLKVTIYCVIACIIGLTVDMVIYYTTKGKGMMVLGIIGFSTYVVVLGINSFLESKKLMARGEKAKKFEEMAYHDQLTGVYNRTAYATDTTEVEKMTDCYAIMMDLNNLKMCNDTKGHEAGDRYIMASVQLIKEVFAKVGRCYRLGGDEFCVLSHKASEQICQGAIEELEQRATAYNDEHPDEFPVSIACGYAAYSDEKDFDFADTLRRADRLMYKRKMEMKQQL